MPAKIKICGICSHLDAEMAINSGADYLGLIFVKSSPRYIEPALAQYLITKLRQESSADKSVQIVGVFQNESKSTIEEITSLVDLDLIQLHGIETPAFCRSLSKPVIKAFEIARKPTLKKSCCTLYVAESNVVGESEDWMNTLREYNLYCQHFLFDRPKEDPDLHWLDYVVKELALREDKLGEYFLAGGLNVNNVGQALQSLHPKVIDVCSGVENAERKKSKMMLDNFFSELQSKTMFLKTLEFSKEVSNL